MTKFTPVPKSKTILAWVLVSILAVATIGASLFIQNSKIFGDFGAAQPTPAMVEVTYSQACADNISALRDDVAKNYKELSGETSTIFEQYRGYPAEIISNFERMALDYDKIDFDPIVNGKTANDKAEYLRNLSQQISDACADEQAATDPCADDLVTLKKMKEVQANEGNTKTSSDLNSIINNYETATADTKYSQAADDLVEFDAKYAPIPESTINFTTLRKLTERFKNKCAEPQATTDPCDKDRITALSNEITAAADMAGGPDSEKEIRNVGTTLSQYEGGYSASSAASDIRKVKDAVQGQFGGVGYDFTPNLEKLASLYDACAEKQAATTDPCGEALKSFDDKKLSAGDKDKLTEAINSKDKDAIRALSVSYEQRGPGQDVELSNLLLQCANSPTITSTNELQPPVEPPDPVRQRELRGEANEFAGYAQALWLAGNVLEGLGLHDLAQGAYGAAGYFMSKALSAQNEFNQQVAQGAAAATGAPAAEQPCPTCGASGSGDRAAGTARSTVFPPGGSGTTTPPFGQGGSNDGLNDVFDEIFKYTIMGGAANLLVGIVELFTGEETTAKLEGFSAKITDFMNTMIEALMVRAGMSYGGYAGLGGDSFYYNPSTDQYEYNNGQSDPYSRRYGAGDYMRQIIADVLPPVDSNSSSPRIILHYAFESLANSTTEFLSKILLPWGNQLIEVYATRAVIYNLTRQAGSNVPQ